MLAPVALATTAFGVASAATWPQATSAPRSASQGQSPAPDNWVARLSAGAPAGAKMLTAEPVMVAHPVSATPALVSALAANGIPQVALNAYRVAAARIDTALPGCHIDWSLIAAIGRVESDHGQFAGATLQGDGTSTPPIIGPALDGRAFAYIADTDQGLYDGDSTYDRAVGPMQFIPSTWSSYSVDGNADGTATPMDINDATLGAAHYLCLAGGDLSAGPGQARAVLAYNHSDAYVAEVLALARGYADGTQVDAPLVGSISAPIDAPTGDYQAPAAPGPAPATSPSGSSSRPRATASRRPATQPTQQTAPRSAVPAAPAQPRQPAPAASSSPKPVPVPVLPVAPSVSTGPVPPASTPTPTCLLPPLCLLP